MPSSDFSVVQTDWHHPSLSTPDVERGILAKINAGLAQADATTPEQLRQATEHADALLHLAIPMDARTIANLKRCRVIAHYGVGVDTIDVDAATMRGILVTNVPTYRMDEVSVHAMTMLLACARQLIPAHQMATKNRQIGIAGLGRIPRIAGSTIGLVGFGTTARGVARKAQGFEMRVVAYDPFVSSAVFTELGVAQRTLEQVMSESDFISIHLPATRQTNGLISDAMIRLMRPTSFLINTSRGSVIEQCALTRALIEGRIAGAGLDILDPEPPDPNELLLSLPNVIVTGHSAFYSEESIIEIQRSAALQVVAALSGEIPINTLNREAVRRSRTWPSPLTFQR